MKAPKFTLRMKPSSANIPRPMLQHIHDEGQSITGGYVYRGRNCRDCGANISTGITSPGRSGWHTATKTAYGKHRC